MAAVLHGWARATADLDVTPAGDEANLERLARALSALNARLLTPGSDEPIDWPWSAAAFAAFRSVTTRTDAGDLDICLRPDAPGGQTFRYEELAERAMRISLPPDVSVASLEDVIASKEASNRPKEQSWLPELRDLLAHRRSVQRRPQQSRD